MKKIFIGLLFIMLALKIRIDLLPDFVGYLLIWKGCAEMSADSSKLTSARSLALVMTAVTAVIFVMGLFGLTSGLGLLGTVIELVMVLGSLLMIFMLGQGICQVQEKNGVELNGQAIINSGKLLAVSEIVAYVLLLIGGTEGVLALVATVLLLASFLFKVVLLISAFMANKMYKAWKNPVEEE